MHPMGSRRYLGIVRETTWGRPQSHLRELGNTRESIQEPTKAGPTEERMKGRQYSLVDMVTKPNRREMPR